MAHTNTHTHTQNNNNFVNCKATYILEIKNLRNKIQYKPK